MTVVDQQAVVLRAESDCGVQWEPRERFHDVFELTCRRLGRRRARRHIAVDYGDYSYTYADLQASANQLARFLDENDVGPGSRLAVLIDRSIQSHALVLAASKVGAAYVPLDPSFPADRVRFIVEDADVDLAVTITRFEPAFVDSDVPVLALDESQQKISRLPASEFEAPECRAQADDLAYIIYTSGTTGRPKGVPINHSSICNFVGVASQMYGYSEADRVYQGMTIAFDFSVEELWVPLASGATLVPAPADVQLVGDDLHDFLRSNRITALCCVPTLLATLEPTLPDLRFLLVSGEACPPDLIADWMIEGRRILNAYGPTETTVTATWKVLTPEAAVTIGRPLPTYSIVIVDPDAPTALGAGEVGEICIGGIGVSEGYLNRPDRTASAFIDDFIGLPDNPTGSIYRTGDMGRINDEGEIEYLGRIDTQVKIRGYRIELDEIESVARKVDGVDQVVVHPWSNESDQTELVAYLTCRAGETLELAAVDAVLRDELPTYMVPAYYELLEELPLLPSTKVDRNALPEPSGVRFTDTGRPQVAPRNERESELAQLLCDVLGLESVSVDADFFDHLGANSLTMAKFVTKIRKSLGIKRVSMKQLYQHPTIEDLAELIEAKAAKSKENTRRADRPATQPPRSPQLPTAPRYEVDAHVASTSSYVACGIAQMAILMATAFGLAVLGVAAYEWIDAANGFWSTYRRSVMAGGVLFFGNAAFLIGVKWLAVGRFDSEPIPIWSAAYLRFWVARTAIRANPLNLFLGTPLYWAFLRMLGTRVGRRAVILSPPPICSDLVTIGDRTTIRSDVAMPGYTAHNGYLFPGSIEIGSDTLICEATTIDIDTKIGDNVQLGTASAVLSGQELDDGRCYHGSPAERTTANFDHVEPRNFPDWHLARFATIQIVVITAWSIPLPLLLLQLVGDIDWLGLVPAPWGGFVGDLLTVAVLAAASYLGAIAMALVSVLVVPRMYNRFFQAGTAHPLWGLQYWLGQRIIRSSNSRPLNLIFGDSSMIVYYLSAIGYDLRESTQTGSNFGVDQRHHSPFLCQFKRNTMVSDGLRMLNQEVSATSFHTRQIIMPPDTYLGNNVFYPADSRVGPNCLIATKAAVPIDGAERTDVGVLGSPAFEIPRSVARDQRFDHFKQPGVIEGRLRAKLRSNLVTLGLYLLRNYVIVFLAFLSSIGFYQLFGAEAGTTIRTAAALSVSTLVVFLSGAALSIYLERRACDFKRMDPLYCSLYDARFWAHERYWKLADSLYERVFNGTPLKGPVLRLRGAIVGKRLFDDGAGLTEPPLVELGDDCMLNVRSELQSHSLEDGTFKSDHIRIGDSCTIGTAGFVHYGTTMQDGSVLEADSFLMKGSHIETGSIWRGNPARDATSELDRSNYDLEEVGK